jgi:hypothetical protein
MSLLDPDRMQITVFPFIFSPIAYRPATDSAPAGYRMIASSSYISSMVFATNPSWMRWTSNFNSLRISCVWGEVRRGCVRCVSWMRHPRRSRGCRVRLVRPPAGNCTWRGSPRVQTPLPSRPVPFATGSRTVPKPVRPRLRR